MSEWTGGTSPNFGREVQHTIKKIDQIGSKVLKMRG